MSKPMQCNFFDIFGLTSDDKYYKSRISLQDKDNYYPKNSIFRFDDKIFGNFIFFYEDKELIIESIKQRKLDDIYCFKIKENYEEKYSMFVNCSIEKNLYRFMSKKRALEAYYEGSFRINNALDFVKDEHNKARKDNENLIMQNLNNCVITNVKSRKNFNATNVVKSTYTLDINNYILCMAYEFDSRLFKEFDSDICLVITDPEEFKSRIKNSIDNYTLISHRVYYGDLVPIMGIMFCKDKMFKIQKEFRFLWKNYDNPKVSNIDEINEGRKVCLENELPEFFYIKVGSLQDISFLVNKDGRRIV